MYINVFKISSGLKSVLGRRATLLYKQSFGALGTCATLAKSENTEPHSQKMLSHDFYKELAQKLDKQRFRQQFTKLNSSTFRNVDIELVFDRFLFFKLRPELISIRELTTQIEAIYESNLQLADDDGLAQSLLKNGHNWSLFVDCFQAIKTVDLGNALDFMPSAQRRKVELYQLKHYSIEAFQTEQIYYCLMKALQLCQERKLNEILDAVAFGDEIRDDKFKSCLIFNDLNESLMQRVNELGVNWKQSDTELDLNIISLKINANSLKVIKHDQNKTTERNIKNALIGA